MCSRTAVRAGLASPLADALLLAAGPLTQAAGLRTVAVVFGAGCDGELTPAEVRARFDEVTAAGRCTRRERSPGGCARRDRGGPPPRPDRGERHGTALRTRVRPAARRSAAGAAPWSCRRSAAGCSGSTLPCALASAARLAAVVKDARSLQEAHELLTARGVRTELAYELDAAASGG